MEGGMGGQSTLGWACRVPRPVYSLFSPPHPRTVFCPPLAGYASSYCSCFLPYSSYSASTMCTCYGASRSLAQCAGATSSGDHLCLWSQVFIQ